MTWWWLVVWPKQSQIFIVHLQLIFLYFWYCNKLQPIAPLRSLKRKTWPLIFPIGLQTTNDCTTYSWIFQNSRLIATRAKSISSIKIQIQVTTVPEIAKNIISHKQRSEIASNKARRAKFGSQHRIKKQEFSRRPHSLEKLRKQSRWAHKKKC